MEKVVELIDAHKRYGSVEAVKGVAPATERGGLVAMPAPTGPGKTPCISLMLGLRKPSSGQAKLFGLAPTDRRARSLCGVMLQESGVPGTLKVKELVDLFRSYYPNPLPAERAIGMAGLEEQADRQAQKLSGGQLQRLYFALAVCGDPQVIFLDEPTVGLDVEARRAFLESIRSFAGEGKTIILTTHYLEEADQLAERGVVLGRRVGAPAPSPAERKSRVLGGRFSFPADRPLSDADFEGLPYQNL